MLILYTKNGTKGTNAILYGGEDFSPHHDGPVYFIETDFGNHIRLSFEEMWSRYTIGPVRNYDEWRQDRQSAIDNQNRMSNVLHDEIVRMPQ